MELKAILQKFNIENLNTMQQTMLDSFKSHSDIILISPTGSGKTLGFILPILQALNSASEGIQALMIVPSRELAIQIEQVFKQTQSAFKVTCCYGGHSVKIEENNLLQPPAVLIGTPGRIAHHLRDKNIDLSSTPYLILDEFDKSLELGFKEEMEYIITKCKQLQKRILTSATALNEVPDFVGLQQPLELNFSNQTEQFKSKLTYKQVKVLGDDKLEALILLLGKVANESTIVFCNHRDAVNRIAVQLEDLNIPHCIYHGALEQIERERSLIKLRNGSARILITTDLAARGLDIPEIKHVIHYQLPLTEDAMIHRNGRTARMQADGTAYFLLDINDSLPSFFKDDINDETLPETFIKPEACPWQTLYIGAGKKDKVNKMDIVGMLLQKGQLQKNEVGRIEVLDHSAYVAIKADKLKQTLKLIRDEKIKNKRVKKDISY